jgi:hypothetical protein
MSGRFINFSQYLSANQANAQRAADTVGDDVERYAGEAEAATSALRDDVAAGNAPSGAQSSLYPGAVSATQRATQGLANTGTAGGLQYELGASGIQGGTLGGERFNSGLAGTVGRERFQAQRSRYAGLQDALSGAASQTFTAPPAAPAPARTPRAPGPPEDRVPAQRQRAQRHLGNLSLDTPDEFDRRRP